jgi:predicted outer membrane repeat protein
MLILKPGITLRGETGAAATVLDAESLGRLVGCNDVGDLVVLEDLTFQNGLALPDQLSALHGGSAVVVSENDTRGGAVDVRGASSPTIRRCVFRQNLATGGTATGGAICAGTITIMDCEFTGNRAGLEGFTNGHGGAVRCAGGLISDCTFRDNHAWGFEAASGGAMRSSSATVRDCSFEGNSVLCPGGPSGGAIFDAGTPTIVRCTFRDNHADGHYFFSNGGAVHLVSGTVADCLFAGNVATCLTGPGRGGGLSGDEFTAARCIFVGNEAMQTQPEGPGHGGAIYARFASLVDGCTLIANSGGTPDGIGGVAFEEQGGTIRASIVALTSVGATCLDNATWICCDLFGNAAGNTPCGTNGGGNFSADPLFCSADPVASADVSIRSDSPCAPGNHPSASACELLGAGPVACTPQSISVRTWSAVKQLYRPAQASVR